MGGRSLLKGPRQFYAALGQGAPVDENDSFADLEPNIFEEERNEIVVHED